MRGQMFEVYSLGNNKTLVHNWSIIYGYTIEFGGASVCGQLGCSLRWT